MDIDRGFLYPLNPIDEKGSGKQINNHPQYNYPGR